MPRPVADQREAPVSWIVRAVLHDGSETTYQWPDVASAVWHAMGLVVGQFPARSVTIERLGE